jgi:hypothetical protein
LLLGKISEGIEHLINVTKLAKFKDFRYELQSAFVSKLRLCRSLSSEEYKEEMALASKQLIIRAIFREKLKARGGIWYHVSDAFKELFWKVSKCL